MPRRDNSSRAIQAGDAGIWATCAMKKEAKSVVDLRDLFQEARQVLCPGALAKLTGGSTLLNCTGRQSPLLQLQTVILTLKAVTSKLK